VYNFAAKSWFPQRRGAESVVEVTFVLLRCTFSLPSVISLHLGGGVNFALV
jgi:hypothetical protein